MRHRLFVLLVGGSLITLPLTHALAAPLPAARTASAARPAKAPATHATTGVVKSLSESSLVLEPTGGLGKGMVFTVAPTTHRDAGIAVGSDVSVRYRTEGAVNMATAVTARHTAKK